VTTTACIWLTGRAGAGKRTIATAIVAELRERGLPAALLDEAGVMGRLVSGPDALAWCCTLLTTNGVPAVVAVPVPSRDDRELLRGAVPGFVEVFLDAPPEVCTERAGRPDDAYEAPYAPELRVPTHGRDAAASAAQVLSFLEDRGVVTHDPRHPSEP
jgi:adenylylsulfate kinase-like enzyme